MMAHETVLDYLTPHRLALHDEMTAREAVEYLRTAHVGDGISYLYLTDRNHHLVGVLPLRRLLMADSDAILRDIAVGGVMTLSEDATVETALELFNRHRFLALPVVDRSGRFLGVVELKRFAGDVLDLAERHSFADAFELIGLHLERARDKPFLPMLKERFPWLMANVAGGMACAGIAAMYEDLLARAVVLALFVPIVLALGESVAIQSLTLTLQRMHGRGRGLGPLASLAGGEIPMGALLGAGCGIIVGGMAWAWKGDPRFALVAFLAITASVTMAAFIGAAMPILTHWSRINPRVVSGPIALALTDMFTMVAYLSLGLFLLR